ncbi:type VI secretion system Vgr family protein [Aquisalimonas sp.]|uniref:type VI secretion system Vgr family protein n=1 Tax=Aquisalimonas sp. TaxID=1872621 RepID=UPI0025BF81A6|nr:type VI secretion system tip protein VgrG [Aquisalimonas sp.]
MSVTKRTIAQHHRRLALRTPLGEDVLALRRIEATEELGRVFQYRLDLLSPDDTIQLQDLLGENVTVRLALADGGERFFNGHISRFMMQGYQGNLAHYEATVVPWLWFLGRTADCRIFQNQSVPEIVAEVFREHGFTDFEDSLTGTYRTREYVVQYRETDLSFVSRLMEHEGIYYFFRHDEDKHTLVLADSPNCHMPCPGCEQIPYYPPGHHAVGEQEYLWTWRALQEVQPGAFAMNDFDFTAPSKSLRSVSSQVREHTMADLEYYDYPGHYQELSDGEAYSRVRVEELQAEYEVFRGEGDTRGLLVGGLFELTDYPREDQNREYLVVAASYEFESDGFESGGADSTGPGYQCRFSALDSRTPFRPRRSTPKPVVQGPQTAIVVGKSGEEIWTDQYGRVKVQFHWDRYGKADENSSCWVRVSHPWAGKQWGAVAVPRIGQEVIVECLEGDPDRPIITGRVYNGAAMPPFDLPDAAMVSGVKSNSTPGGGGYNEISMDDTAGEELLHVHAEKDQDIVVGNDESHAVGHDRSKSVGNDEHCSVGANETIQIGADRTETVGGNESVTVAQDRAHTVSKHDTLTVALTRTASVGINDMVNVGGAQETNVGGARSVIVGGLQSTTVGASKTEKVIGSSDENVGGNRSSSVGDNDSLQVGKQLTIEAGEQVVIKTGKASITMKKDGTIIIEGKDITTKGSGEVNTKANKNVVIKGKKVLQN